MKLIRNHINGKLIEAKSTDYINVENPSTGEVIARTPLTTAEETDRAIEAAHAAFASSCGKMRRKSRGLWLKRWASLCPMREQR